MEKKALIAACVAGMLPVASAHAFGLGDLVSIGIQAGGEIVRAVGSKAVDAVKDSLRDPEAEAREKAEKERKFAEQMQKQIDEIERTPNLRPIDRERLVLALQKSYRQAKEMQAFVERAEAAQKAQRDQVLTLGGVAGVIGQAALSSPSVVLAQADALSRNPLYRAQIRANNEAVFRQADAMVAAGVPQAKDQIALAQADVLQKSGIQQVGAEEVLRQADALARQGVTQKDVERAVDGARAASEPVGTDTGTAAGAQQEPSVAPSAVAAQKELSEEAGTKDAFSPDLGRKLYVEFVGSQKETQKLRDLLTARGHSLAASPGEAEVIYLIEGEYTVPETKQYKSVTASVGDLLENPGEAVPTPEKKLMGSIGAGVAKFLLLGAAAQGQPVPADAMPQDGVFSQEVLLVIARQPKNGKETRYSVVKSETGPELKAASLSIAAKESLYQALGI